VRDLFGGYGKTVLSNDAATMAALAVVIGTIYCFAGYRVFKFVLGLTGFVLAGAVAAHLAMVFFPSHSIIRWVALIGGGLAGAIAMLAFYEIGVFLIGLLGALLVTDTVLSGYSVSWGPWAMVGGAVAGGLLAVLLERPIMTLATAAIGAWGVVAGVAYFAMDAPLFSVFDRPFAFEGNGWICAASWAVLTCAGAGAQFSTRKRKPATVQDAAK